jgi:subtilisin family serine protease
MMLFRWPFSKDWKTMQTNRGSARLSLSLCLSLLVAGGLMSCQKRSSSPRASVEQDPGGLIIPTQPLPPLDANDGVIKWPNGQISLTMKIKNRNYIRVNGLVAPVTYSQFLERGSPVHNAEVKDAIRQSLVQSLNKLEADVNEEFLLKDIVPEAGYYSMWIPYSDGVWSRLQAVKELPVPMTLEAVTTDPDELQRVVRQSERINQMIVAGQAKDKTDGFSGLVRIGVTHEWLQTLEQELGERPDGSLVRLGITDTGITYNHPSFLDHEGKPRVIYMKDFTQEGKVYFPGTARFSVRLGTAADALRQGTHEENLLIAEDVAAHVNTVASTPAADGINLVSLPKGAAMIVPADVRRAVQDGASVRLAFLAELGLGASFDLNRNRKNDDLLGLILVSPHGSVGLADSKVYIALDPIGTLAKTNVIMLNERLELGKAIPLRDFNSSRDVAQSFAEKFGLAFESMTLKSHTGQDVDTIAVSIVGYDSGLHGSHVAGIAAGRKTLLNDSDFTLARGVAPNAQILSNRVCANTRGCSASSAIIDLALEAKADVINMSLGGLSNMNDGYDTQSLLIDRLSQISNTQFIISAGNSGPGLQTVGSPSSARHAISVAASASTDIMGRQSQISIPSNGKDEDFVMNFSSRGPLGNGGFKPNVTAPGTQLSAVALNKAGRAGTDIMQGTSMSAPTVTGAYALLLDAARRYNKKHPDAPLPTDNVSLRKVLIGSAKPFDAKIFDPETRQTHDGQYTWIDQGTGLINMPAAWAALKKLATQRVPTGINIGGKDIEPVYEVRTLMTNRYGQVYDGKPVEGNPVTAYGAGLWIDARAPRALYSVGVARRLPLVADGAMTAEQQGDAYVKLVSSGEFFKLHTEIHGSSIEWLKANTLAAANPDGSNRCDTISGSTRLTLVGQGALDAPSIGGTQESVVYVCIDREKLALLPKGDHGALIRAYRQSADGSVVENVPAFIIPVYLSLPHETLMDGKAYTVTQDKVKALGLSRNYVEVPADTSSLRVSLSVNKAVVDPFGQAQNCSGVYLNTYAADNKLQPDELSNAVVFNCAGPGYSVGPDDDLRSSFVGEVVAPKAGIWDMHVEGLSRYPLSSYQLRVDYVKAASQQKEVKGGIEALNGSLNIEIKEGSLSFNVNPDRSSYILDQAVQSLEAQVKNGEQVEVPNRAGVLLRTYPASVAKISVTTGGAPDNDLDLEIHECIAGGTECKIVGSSGSPTDEELASFVPKEGRSYKFVVDGYKVPNGQTSFQMTESITFAQGAVGTLSASQLGSERFWNVVYSLSKDDLFFQSEIFVKDPSYEARGTIRVASNELTLAVVPVQVRLR